MKDQVLTRALKDRNVKCEMFRVLGFQGLGVSGLGS